MLVLNLLIRGLALFLSTSENYIWFIGLMGFLYVCLCLVLIRLLAHIEGFQGIIIERPFELNVCAKSNFICLLCDLQQCYPGVHARIMSTLHPWFLFSFVLCPTLDKSQGFYSFASADRSNIVVCCSSCRIQPMAVYFSQVLHPG